MTKNLIILILLLSAVCPASGTRYYVSPTGNDAYDGHSPRKAFAKLTTAQALVQPGDSVFILPGTFMVAAEEFMAEENAGKTGQYKIVYHFSKSGNVGNPICYIGQSDENGNRPVFDFSNVKPENWRVTAFLVSANHLLFKNFEVVGIQVNRTDHTQSENFRITNGSFNTFENIACHDGMGIGFYLTKSSACNLFVNCDGYNNYDPISDISEKTGMGTGGNNDGFGCHVNKEGYGNIFVGCRAWNNADDGYDLISCEAATVFCYSVAYKNGYDAENISRGDGNGFKAGGFGMDEKHIVLPDNRAPMHMVYDCIAATNKTNGFYSNHHLGGIWLRENTAYRNSSYNYSLVNRQGAGEEEAVDVNGYGHRLEFNLSMVSDSKENHLVWLRGDEGDNYIDGNTFEWISKNSGGWNYKAYGNSIFESTKVANLIVPRNTDGMLSEETLAVMRQKSYVGMGCSFEGYEEEIVWARSQAGAEAGMTPTGISTVKYVSTNNTVYDLQGHRKSHAEKGLHICNGRKIIIR